MKQMSHNATNKLANLIEHADYSDFTAEDIAAAKASVLDFIGVAFAGFRETQLNRLLMDAMAQSDSSGHCTILGESKKMMKPLNAGKAAYNGVLSAILVQGGASGPQNILEQLDNIRILTKLLGPER